MNNVFNKNERRVFSWDAISPKRIKDGRLSLGEEMPVFMHRLMDNTLYDVLSNIHGEEKTNQYFRMAGVMAGSALATNMMDCSVDFSTFLANLQELYIELKIGILRVEQHDTSSGELVVTIGEDNSCSGLPVTNNIVCHYDEGVLSGIFQFYSKQNYEFTEIDCWASGARICRFKGIIQ